MKPGIVKAWFVPLLPQPLCFSPGPSSHTRSFSQGHLQQYFENGRINGDFMVDVEAPAYSALLEVDSVPILWPVWFVGLLSVFTVCLLQTQATAAVRHLDHDLDDYSDAMCESEDECSPQGPQVWKLDSTCVVGHE